MDKKSLAAGILAIYAFIVMIAIFLYAIIDQLGLKETQSTNLLVWSATIFAPIALLMTYNGWREQKAVEILASESKIFFSFLHDNYQDINTLIGLAESKGNEDHQFHSVRKRYSDNLRFLNLYVALIGHTQDGQTKIKIDEYINKLGLVFNQGKLSFETSDLIKSLMEINELGNNLQPCVLDYILHKK